MIALFNTISDITSAIVFLIIILALVLAKKYGILSFFQKNSNGNGMEKQLKEIRENHFHTLEEKAERAEVQHDKMLEISQESLLILRDIKNKM